MARTPYTQAEQDYLRANAQVLSLQEMADSLGRTEKSVRSFFNKRQIPTRKDYYSPVEKQYIFDNAGILTWGEIAEALGRTEQAVSSWASKHDISGSFEHPRKRSFLGLTEVQCGGLFCDVVFRPVRARQLYCSDGCFQTIHRLKKYNLDKQSWWSIFRLQGERCVCGGTETVIGWHVDHDHTCCADKGSCGKCIRGILCSRCNLALGMVRDRPETLRKLAEYLENSNTYSKEM